MGLLYSYTEKKLQREKERERERITKGKLNG